MVLTLCYIIIVAVLHRDVGTTSNYITLFITIVCIQLKKTFYILIALNPPDPFSKPSHAALNAIQEFIILCYVLYNVWRMVYMHTRCS